MSIPIIVVLILIGLLMLVLEILIIPGIIVGIIGFVIVTWAITSAYSVHGSLAGHIVLLSTILLSIIIIVFIFKSKTWAKLALNQNITSKVNTNESEIFVGEEGITISRLAPMGKAKIGNQIVEVSTQGDFINENTKIIVIKSEESKIFVKQLV